MWERFEKCICLEAWKCIPSSEADSIPTEWLWQMIVPRDLGLATLQFNGKKIPKLFANASLDL